MYLYRRTLIQGNTTATTTVDIHSTHTNIAQPYQKPSSVCSGSSDGLLIALNLQVESDLFKRHGKLPPPSCAGPSRYDTTSHHICNETQRPSKYEFNKPVALLSVTRLTKYSLALRGEKGLRAAKLSCLRSAACARSSGNFPFYKGLIFVPLLCELLESGAAPDTSASHYIAGRQGDLMYACLYSAKILYVARGSLQPASEEKTIL